MDKPVHRLKISKNSTLSTTGETIQTPTSETIQTPTQAQYPLALRQRWSPLDLRVVQRLDSKGQALLFERDDP